MPKRKASAMLSFEKQLLAVIGTTVEGTLLITAVHNRVGGAGPTLTEIA